MVSRRQRRRLVSIDRVVSEEFLHLVCNFGCGTPVDKIDPCLELSRNLGRGCSLGKHNRNNALRTGLDPHRRASEEHQISVGKYGCKQKSCGWQISASIGGVPEYSHKCSRSLLLCFLRVSKLKLLCLQSRRAGLSARRMRSKNGKLGWVLHLSFQRTTSWLNMDTGPQRDSLRRRP